MKFRNLATIGLLLFVAASITVLAVKSLRRNPPAAAAAASEEALVFYFHGNVRCPTCRSIEAYAHEALQSGFADQLRDRRIGWRVVNYELPGNEHFLTDYELVFPSVILVKLQQGRQTNWKNLDRVWELVGDKREFVEYFQQEARAFVEDSADDSPAVGVARVPQRP